MAKGNQRPEPKDEPSESKPPDVFTVSEFNQLSDADKQAFRNANGTVTNDPISTN